MVDVKNKDRVRIGETYEIEVTGLAHDGEGVGRIGDLAVFILGAIPGDKVKARIISTKKTYARAQTIKIITPSPNRCQSDCEVADTCGGCQLHTMKYEEQLKWKEQFVIDALSRIGGLDPSVLPIKGMDNPLWYRNKAQIPVGKQSGQLVMGFYKTKSHEIVSINKCLLQHPLINKAMDVLIPLLNEHRIKPYNEVTHTGFLRHVIFRASISQNQVMLVLVTRTEEFPQFSLLIKELKQQLPELVSVAQNINPEKTNTIYGGKTKILWGEKYLIEELGGLKFAISPRSFFQVNPIQTKVLYDCVKEFADLKGEESIWDIYCGTGTIGLYLASKAKAIYGIETIESAVEDANLNAQLNKVTNAEFFFGKAEEVLPTLAAKDYPMDLVIVDPPRKGCETTVLDVISQMNVPKVIYVSCNPTTLARDLRYLVDNGYRVEVVQPVDMFPMTSHVECVTLMSKVEK